MTDHPSALVSVPVDLIRRAMEEIRMIRMKDSDAVYDTTLRLDLQLALAAAPAPAPDALRDAVEASKFLLDRLRDLEWDVNERDFNGHVLPAASRLRQALAALQAQQKGGA